MFRGPSRRRFLQATLTTGVWLAARPFAQHSDPFHVTPLPGNLRLVTGAGGNVVAAKGPDGVLLVNGGAAAHAADLLRFLGEGANGARIATLFNTDWHPDHTGLNDALGRSGTRIVAHEHTRQYLSEDLLVEWQRRTVKALPAHARPAQTFRSAGKMTVGDEVVEYGPLGQAHTDGDIYVFFRNANVLVAGDVVAVGAYPIADYTSGGWLGGLATATRTLIDLTNPDTRIVPGTGPVQTRADLEAQHQMLVAMRDRIGKMMRQGMSADDMIAAGATKDFDAKWGSPQLFMSTAYRGMWLHVRELGGIV